MRITSHAFAFGSLSGKKFKKSPRRRIAASGGFLPNLFYYCESYIASLLSFIVVPRLRHDNYFLFVQSFLDQLGKGGYPDDDGFFFFFFGVCSCGGVSGQTFFALCAIARSSFTRLFISFRQSSNAFITSMKFCGESFFDSCIVSA